MPLILRLASLLGSYCSVAQPIILLPSNAPTNFVLMSSSMPGYLAVSRGIPSLKTLNLRSRCSVSSFPIQRYTTLMLCHSDSFISDMRVTALVSATVSRLSPMVLRKNQPMFSNAVAITRPHPNPITIFPSETLKPTTRLRIMTRTNHALDASLGVFRPLWSWRGASRSGIPRNRHMPV